MSKQWSELTFQFETSEGQMLTVELCTYATGTYDEPMLELDGDAVVTCNGAEVPTNTLSDADQRRLDNAIENCLNGAQDTFADSIAQEVYEDMASRAYDMWKDRMKYGDE